MFYGYSLEKIFKSHLMRICIIKIIILWKVYELKYIDTVADLPIWPLVLIGLFYDTLDTTFE